MGLPSDKNKKKNFHFDRPQYINLFNLGIK